MRCSSQSDPKTDDDAASDNNNNLRFFFVQANYGRLHETHKNKSTDKAMVKKNEKTSG
jgi:hypothetical protein